MPGGAPIACVTSLGQASAPMRRSACDELKPTSNPACPVVAAGSWKGGTNASPKVLESL